MTFDCLHPQVLTLLRLCFLAAIVAVVILQSQTFQKTHESFPKELGWETRITNATAESIQDKYASVDIHHDLYSPFDTQLVPNLLQFQPKAHLIKRQHKKHPFLGASFPNGSLGFVCNPKAHQFHEHMRPFVLSPEEKNIICDALSSNQPTRQIDEREATSAATKHIQIAPPPPPEIPSRVLCCVYTHEGAIPQTESIRQTWGRKCDGILFASTITDPAFQKHPAPPFKETADVTNSSLHFRLHHDSKWEGQYKGLWQRIRSLYAYIYMHYLNDYDYFHICGDDTFVIVENLRAYLTTPPVANLTLHGKPFWGGFWTHWDDKFSDFYYLGGGPGYTLNSRAIQIFVETVSETCPKRHQDGPAEDWNVAWCFQEIYSLTGMDTRDSHGAHRYHLMSLTQHALFPKRSYGMSSKIVRKSLTFLQEKHGFPLQWGLDYLSTNSVSFHNYKTPLLMKELEILLYGGLESHCSEGDIN